MRILHRYITSSFLITFVVTLVVFTFVMCISLIFRVNDLLVRGVPWKPVFQIVFSGVPSLLALSIPISLITSSLLVFGRLSADGELAAMRACGVSVEQLVAGPVFVGMLFTCVCIYVNYELAPRGHWRRKEIRVELGVMRPLDFLEEGTFIHDFAGLTIYLGRMDGNDLHDVRISDTRERGIRREVRAKTGRVVTLEDGAGLTLELHDVMVDPFSRDTPEALFCKTWPIRISEGTEKRKYNPREKDLTIPELFDRITHPGHECFEDSGPEDRNQEIMLLTVELNKRLALSFSCFGFVLLGIPLGIKAHRKESTIGIAISLVLVFNFYLFIIIAESLSQRPALRPDVITWVPVILSIVIGTRLLKRSE